MDFFLIRQIWDNLSDSHVCILTLYFNLGYSHKLIEAQSLIFINCEFWKSKIFTELQ